LFSEGHREAARAAAHIQNSIAWSQLQIVSEHGTHATTAPAEQPIPNVIEPRPVDEAVMLVVISTA
jgi:hypothetical protein